MPRGPQNLGGHSPFNDASNFLSFSIRETCFFTHRNTVSLISYMLTLAMISSMLVWPVLILIANSQIIVKNDHMAPTWYTENSPEIFSHNLTLHVEKKRPPRESPYNAVLKDPVFSPIEGATAYWEVAVDVMPSTLFFGVARVIDSPLSFVSTGYNMKFLGFGGPGNLADGSSSLASRWGPALGPNTTKIGVLSTITQGRLNVYFYVDGGPLGLGYSLPANLFPLGVRFAIQTTGPAQFVYLPDSTPPVERDRPKSIPKGIEGIWSVEGGQWLTEDLVNITKQPTLELSVKNEDSYAVNVRVVNFARTVITKQSNNEWKCGPVMTTEMLGPENLMTLEGRLLKFIENAVKWSLSPDGSTMTVSALDESLILTRIASQEKLPEVLNVSWLLDQ